MTQTEKILVYSLAMIVFKEKENYYFVDYHFGKMKDRVGICWVLRKINFRNRDKLLVELSHETRPLDKFWFPRTDSGDKQRIKLLKKAIKEANKTP